MKIKLTRKETVAACNFLGTINLRGADENFARKVIIAQMALHSVAKKIVEEEELVRAKFIDTDEAKDKCQAFTKAYQEMIASRKEGSNVLDKDAVQAFSSAYEQVRPYNESIDKAFKALEEKFKFSPDIDPFSLEELVAHFSKIGVDFNLRSFDPITKFIK